VFKVEQEECGLGDRANACRTEADRLQGGEGLFEKSVRAFGRAMHAADDHVVSGECLGQFAIGRRLARGAIPQALARRRPPPTRVPGPTVVSPTTDLPSERGLWDATTELLRMAMQAGS